MSPPRQTLSYLRNLFARRGIAPQHRHGQNFLIDLNLHDLLVREADLGPNDVVLEVGSGTGALTSRLAERAAAVVSVEIDPGLAELTREAVAGRPNVRVLNTDALAGKHKLNPQVVDQVRSALAATPGRTLKLVANLPFHVATPVLTNLLVDPELVPVRMVVTVQRELAERMLSPPASEAYGALSVLVQALAEVRLVRVLPQSVFWPRPKVESAIISIVPRADLRAAIADLPWFHAVVRRVFLHRRKHLRGVIAAAWSGHWTKADVDALLEELDLDGRLRAEALNVSEWIALANAIKTRLGPSAVAETEEQLGLETAGRTSEKTRTAGPSQAASSSQSEPLLRPGLTK